jgi:hypothetical protein
MGRPKGSGHTEETKAKMSATRTGRRFSEEHKARISAGLKGKTKEKTRSLVCQCGSTFKTAANNAMFCSDKCKRASKGHGLLHSPRFRHFARCCAICAATDDLVGDHDHATGLARGVLCRNCNLAIGNFRDDPVRLRAAAAYLERHAIEKCDATYISGPMSNLPGFNYPAFNRAAASLRSRGIRVENPAENDPPTCGTWEGWMKIAILQLLRCTSIVMLPGWENSRGARLEHELAVDLGMNITFWVEQPS